MSTRLIKSFLAKFIARCCTNKNSLAVYTSFANTVLYKQIPIVSIHSLYSCRYVWVCHDNNV